MASVIDYMNIANNLAQQNNEWSAKQAEKQMQFQLELSNTAHQREVADLKAAGLNPVLSASHNGASTPTGSMGTTDNSNVEAVVSLLTHFGESIAQATAKGAATGGAAGTVTNIAEQEHNARIKAVQEEIKAIEEDKNKTAAEKEAARKRAEKRLQDVMEQKRSGQSVENKMVTDLQKFSAKNSKGPSDSKIDLALTLLGLIPGQGSTAKTIKTVKGALEKYQKSKK